MWPEAVLVTMVNLFSQRPRLFHRLCLDGILSHPSVPGDSGVVGDLQSLALHLAFSSSPTRDELGFAEYVSLM